MVLLPGSNAADGAGGGAGTNGDRRQPHRRHGRRGIFGRIRIARPYGAELHYRDSHRGLRPVEYPGTHQAVPVDRLGSRRGVMERERRRPRFDVGDSRLRFYKHGCKDAHACNADKPRSVDYLLPHAPQRCQRHGRCRQSPCGRTGRQPPNRRRGLGDRRRQTPARRNGGLEQFQFFAENPRDRGVDRGALLWSIRARRGVLERLLDGGDWRLPHSDRIL